MSAVFEIELLLKNQLLISDILNFMKKEDLDYEINLIQAQDDWEFSNQKSVIIEQIETCDDLVKQGKIVLISGILKAIYRFGFYLWKLEKNVFAMNFWISTKGIEMLDNNYITKENVGTYAFITNKITSVLNKDILLIGAIGSELIISFKNDLEDTINKSKNVCEWIFADEKNYSYFDKYSKLQINGFIIYCLIN